MFQGILLSQEWNCLPSSAVLMNLQKRSGSYHDQPMGKMRDMMKIDWAYLRKG